MRFLWLPVIALSLLGSCSGRNLSHEEAVRSLKVLNSDLMNFFSAAAEKPEWKALMFLYDQPSLRLPFSKDKFSFDKPYSEFDFHDEKGHYDWDFTLKQFARKQKGDDIEVHFPSYLSDSLNTCFRLYDYESVPVSSRPWFPVKADGSLAVDGVIKLKFAHTARVGDDLPLSFNTVVDGEGYQVISSFSRTREGDRGTIGFLIKAEMQGNEVISGTIDASVGYSKIGYYFEDINLSFRLFSHLVKGRIRYGMINPTTENYVDSFNRNTDLGLFELQGNRKVGDIVLGSSNHGELLNYYIRFSGGKEELAATFIPMLDKLLNLKY